MNYQGIIKAVDDAIDELCETFRSHPTHFYTENDTKCYFYNILHTKLPISKDKNGKEHFLIHTGYPTPFRCDMHKGKFEIKREEDRTNKGGKYKRGHYDIVVLNPEFISQYDYKVIKAQDYESYLPEVVKNNKCSPVVLYGLEFVFSRKLLTTEKGPDNFRVEVTQDVKKLIESKNLQGKLRFMDQVKLLAFIFTKKSPEKQEKKLYEMSTNRADIVYCVVDINCLST